MTITTVAPMDYNMDISRSCGNSAYPETVGSTHSRRGERIRSALPGQREHWRLHMIPGVQQINSLYRKSHSLSGVLEIDDREAVPLLDDSSVGNLTALRRLPMAPRSSVAR
jgi:hypothetical protein